MLVAPLDVERPETIAAAIEAGVARFGGIDMLLNNAGISVPGVFEAASSEKIQESFRVNVLGVMDVTRAILPHFRSRKGGTIVNVSSGAGIVGLPLNSVYSATKFAIEGFSESLAFELLAQNIVVKLIEPGLVKTNMTAGWIDSLTPSEPIADYESYIASIHALYAGMMDDNVPEASTVAQTIFEAATDGTERLRYLVTEGATSLVEPRRTLTEEAYVESMREAFRV
ncbi:SDR family NAD(P)-dependent oxidoreductase [bacterium]|nr:MAG: SDR family NAD(P)-dependent oxidoreductase [bacterium]